MSKMSCPSKDTSRSVTFAETTQATKKTEKAVATPTSEVTAPPPLDGFKIKDEVEMLRAGFKNRHGDAVKSSAETMNIEI